MISDAESAVGEPAQEYERLWRVGRAALIHGTYRCDERPTDGTRRWGLSAVFELPEPMCGLLERELETIRERSGNAHLYYQPNNFHITIRTLEGYRTFIPPEHVDHYVRQAKEAADGLVPQIRLRGLCASDGGIFACGYANSDVDLMRRRLAIAAESYRSVGPPGVDDRRIRNTLHVSLMVFVGRRPAALPALAQSISERRTADFGSFAPRALRLVSYEWTADTVRMNQLASIPL